MAAAGKARATAAAQVIVLCVQARRRADATVTRHRPGQALAVDDAARRAGDRGRPRLRGRARVNVSWTGARPAPPLGGVLPRRRDADRHHDGGVRPGRRSTRSGPVTDERYRLDRAREHGRATRSASSPSRPRTTGALDPYGDHRAGAQSANDFWESVQGRRRAGAGRLRLRRRRPIGLAAVAAALAARPEAQVKRASSSPRSSRVLATPARAESPRWGSFESRCGDVPARHRLRVRGHHGAPYGGGVRDEPRLDVPGRRSRSRSSPGSGRSRSGLQTGYFQKNGSAQASTSTARRRLRRRDEASA